MSTAWIDSEQDKAEQMDHRVEDVARTMHYLGALEPERYFDADYEYPWESEAWGHVKAVRAEARDLIDKFDARAVLGGESTT